MGFSIEITGDYVDKNKKGDGFKLYKEVVTSLDISIDGDGRNEIGGAMFKISAEGRISSEIKPIDGGKNSYRKSQAGILSLLNNKNIDKIGPVKVMITDKNGLFRYIEFPSCVDISYEESYYSDKGDGIWTFSIANKQSENGKIDLRKNGAPI